MADTNKKVFLSYRRELSKYASRSVYQHLRSEGFDVFMDVESIDSGQFASVILNQIGARPHFLIILTPGSLMRTGDRDDWLRREIEYALDKDRNIVPVLMEGFDLKAEEKRHPGKKLPGKLAKLKDYNWLTVPDDYFEDAMNKLIKRFLKKPVAVDITKTPKNELKVVSNMIKIADLAKVDSLKNLWVLPETLPKKQLKKIPLATPILESVSSITRWNLPGLTSLKWNTILGASGYIVQKSKDPSFATVEEVYNGNDTTYTESALFSAQLPSLGFTANLGLSDYYRVKAKGRYLFIDSPWSNVVEIKPPEKTALAAPVLEEVRGVTRWSIPEQTNLKWNKISGAAGYILQKSKDRSFTAAEEVYNGDDTSYIKSDLFTTRLPSLDFAANLGLSDYYRVKAKGGYMHLDSPWSNVVTIKPPKRTPLAAPVLEEVSGVTLWNLQGQTYLKWNKIEGATGYILQKSNDRSFTKADEVYDGGDTSYQESAPSVGRLPTLGLTDYFKLDDPFGSHHYYRVKAKGGYLRVDSPWSNIVEVKSS